MLASPQNEIVLHFKTKPCKKTHAASHNDSCSFYHSPEDRRRPLFNASGSPLYLNILYMPGLVPEADKEKFSLNLAEYNYHISNFRTKHCPYLKLNGICELGEVCPYIHGQRPDDPLENYRKVISSNHKSSNIGFTVPALIDEAEKCTVKLSGDEEAYIAGVKTDFKEDAQHAFIELKDSNQIERKLRSLQEYMCAFSNTEGGIVYLGIKKPGYVTGILCDRQTMDRIRLIVDNTVICYHDQ